MRQQSKVSTMQCIYIICPAGDVIPDAAIGCLLLTSHMQVYATRGHRDACHQKLITSGRAFTVEQVHA